MTAATPGSHAAIQIELSRVRAGYTGQEKYKFGFLLIGASRGAFGRLLVSGKDLRMGMGPTYPMARVGCARRFCFDLGLRDHHCRSGEEPWCFCDWCFRGIKCVDRNLLAERRAAELAVGIASQIRTTRSNGLAGSVLSIGLSVGREPLIFAVRRTAAIPR